MKLILSKRTYYYQKASSETESQLFAH